jgi:NinB protein
MKRTFLADNPVQARPMFENNGALWMHVKALTLTGKPCEISVGRKTRTPAQNRRYWSRGVLSQIAMQAEGGKYSAEVWHELLKRMFIGVTELPNGEVIGKSSKSLSTAEFCEFCDKVEAHAITDLGVVFEDLLPH